MTAPTDVPLQPTALLAGPPAARRVPRRPADWPLIALVAWYPVWWILGLGSFIIPILAIPMALGLCRRRPIKLPRGFSIWLLFLAWNLLGILVLDKNAPHTVAGSLSGRLIGFGFRNAFFIAITVIFLFAGNLTEQEMPRQRMVRLLSWFFLITVAGGLLSSAFPHFSFTSPIEELLPHHIRTNLFVQSLVHPAAAQVQDVLGFATARPKAPFDYTNSWGNNYAVLLTWFVVAWWVQRRWLQRFAALVVLAASAVPVVYSLDRGLWIALAVAAAMVAARQLARGRVTPVILIITVLAGVAIIGASSPLGTVIEARIAHPHSNAIRGNLDSQAVDAAKVSPILGFGSTRNAVGSPQSVAVGKSPACLQCGNAPVGSTGELWHDLIAVGFVGAGLYLWFFAAAIWRYRRDTSAIGIAGTTVLGMALVFGLFYDALPSALLCYLLSYSLLWRNDMEKSTPGAQSLPRRPVATLPRVPGQRRIS